MTPQERATACVLAASGGPLVWASDGVTFRAEEILLTPEGDGVSATLTAWTGDIGGESYLPTDNPYIIMNPPVYVSSDGENVVFYPLGALKESFTETVFLVARRQGWT